MAAHAEDGVENPCKGAGAIGATAAMEVYRVVGLVAEHAEIVSHRLAAVLVGKEPLVALRRTVDVIDALSERRDDEPTCFACRPQVEIGLDAKDVRHVDDVIGH